MFLVTPYSVGIRVIIPFAAFACFWAWASGVFAWYKGQRSAGIYVLAWSGLLTGGIILALNKMQIIPRNFFTDYAVQMGTLLEVLLLSFALAERINHERTLRLNAQNHSLGMQKKSNEELEYRVIERTKELEIANSKLQELSDTDQLTGLKNRRFLDLYIDKEIARGVRYQHNLAVLLIDIDHFKTVNDQYGHLVGDDCLKEVAKIFSTQILRRPTDLSARYGGEEFCVVLPETNNKGAISVANRIRENIQQLTIESRGFNGHLTISVGVYAAVPSSNELSSEYLERADNALYLAKENGRNRVEVYAGDS
jgi:diguanylate cyclase